MVAMHTAMKLLVLSFLLKCLLAYHRDAYIATAATITEATHKEDVTDLHRGKINNLDKARKTHSSHTHYGPKDDKIFLECDPNSIKMDVKSWSAWYYSTSDNTKNERRAFVPYGAKNVEVICNGGRLGRITMTRDGQRVSGVVIEGDVVKSTLPSDFQTTEYVCTNEHAACNRSLTIIMKQVMHAISPDYGYNSDDYIIKYGNPVTVSCSGPASARLAITKDEAVLKTERVNNNEIKVIVSEPEYESKYVCINLDTNVNSSLTITVRPSVFIRFRNETITPDYYHMFTRTSMYRIMYDDTIEFFCTAPRDVDLTQNGKVIPKEKVNATTVKSVISNWEMGQSSLGCVDSKLHYYSDDYMNLSNLQVIVRPRMVVVSSNIRRFGNRYVVKPGEQIEIFCSGPIAEPLTITKVDTATKVADRVNETTVKWLINKTEIHYEYDEYFCSSKNEKKPYELAMCGIDSVSIHKAHRNEDERRAKIVVEVNIPPSVEDFHCMSHELKFMNCSWSTSSYGINFTLSYIYNGNSITVCERFQEGIGRKFCVFDYHVDIKTFSFLMQSCNGLGCSNETFVLEHLSIVKPPPPRSLNVDGIHGRNAYLNWDYSSLELAGQELWTHYDFDFKVEYSFSGLHVVAKNAHIQPMPCCSVFLQLLCPQQFYEVQLFQKLKSAVGDEFWSDPSTVTLSTNFEKNNSNDVHPICNQEPKKTTDVMTYLIRQLRNDVNHELESLNKDTGALKNKRGKL